MGQISDVEMMETLWEEDIADQDAKRSKELKEKEIERSIKSKLRKRVRRQEGILRQQDR